MSHGARLCTLLVGVPTILGLAAVACSSQSPTPVTVTIFAAAQSTPTAIVVHGDVVYWIDSGSDTIMAQPTAGGIPVTLASGQYNPTALAVDDTNVYWANAGSGECTDDDYDAPRDCPGAAIMRAPLVGGPPEKLAAAESPTSLVVDATNLYWGNDPHDEYDDDDEGAIGSVVKLPLAGGSPVTLVSGLAGTISLTVGAFDLYWTASDGYPNGTLSKIPIAGGYIGVLPETLEKPGPVTSDSTHIFWLDGEGPEGSEQTSIFSVPIGGAPAVRLAVSPGGAGYDGFVAGIAADATNVYWTTIFSGYSAIGGAVLSVPLAGGAITTLATADTSGGGIAVDGTNVYWTTSNAVMKLAPKTATGAGVTADAAVSSTTSTTCGEQLVLCGSECIRVLEDSSNCGGCGITCPDDQFCQDAECACGEDLDLCAGTCVDCYQDHDNCGGCGIVCGPAQACIAGSCE